MRTIGPSRRSVLSGALACGAALRPDPAGADDEKTWAALASGGIVLFRHAIAPGVGDPSAFKIDACGTQRNLDDVGRAQARSIGAAFAQRGIRPGQVLSSQWCRTRETADLAFPGMRQDAPAFNSFFENRGAQSHQTTQARTILKAWQGPGVLVVVTHEVNITALTGLVPASGEGVVVATNGNGLTVVGRIKP